MNYTYEVRKLRKDSYTEEEWVIWTKGNLEECFEDFFYHQMHPLYGQSASRITWEMPTE